MNKAGYAVVAGKGEVSYVNGTWVVPQANCSNNSQFASFWLGIDGYNTKTVEQIGTDSDCINGVPIYYAWYEFYPRPARLVNRFPVKPGDAIFAEVKYENERFALKIRNLNTNQTFSVVSRMPTATRSVATWVVEAPVSPNHVVPLTNFGSIEFGIESNGAGGCRAIVGNRSGAIGDFGNLSRQINMERLGEVKARASNLSANGSVFYSYWKAS
jgi:hypothetical protein